MDLDDLDLTPYMAAAKERGRSLFVYIVDGRPTSTIHLFTVPTGVQYLNITKTGHKFKMEPF